MSRRRIRQGEREHGGERGFVLLEALATLALSALVLGALLALGGGLSRVMDRMAARAEGGEGARRVVSVMADEIARLSRRKFSGEETRYVFFGAADRVVFAVEALQPNGLAAPVVVAYQSSGPGEAFRAEGALPVGAADLDAVDLTRPRRLGVGGEIFRLAYVERLESGGELITDDWVKPGVLPRAIRIDRIDGDSGATIASRRVAIIAEADAACADPEALACSTAKKRPPARGEPGDPALRNPRSQGVRE